MPYDGTGLDKATKVLIEARRLVEEGWCQGAYEDAAGRVCLHRATVLGCFVVTFWDWKAAYSRVRALIPPTYEGVFLDPVQAWNDAYGRTQAEVLALLDRAIAGG